MEQNSTEIPKVVVSEIGKDQLININKMFINTKNISERIATQGDSPVLFFYIN